MTVNKFNRAFEYTEIQITRVLRNLIFGPACTMSLDFKDSLNLDKSFKSVLKRKGFSQRGLEK